VIAVIDVSGITQILFQREKKDKFYRVLQEASLVLAPDIYVSELSNTLWKYHKAQKYTVEECNQFIEDGLNYVDEFIDSKEIWKEAFSEGAKNGHPVYDMLYAVITRRNSGILISDDRDLSAICGKLNIDCCC